MQGRLLSSLSESVADVTEGILNAPTIVNLNNWSEKYAMESKLGLHTPTFSITVKNMAGIMNSGSLSYS